MYHRAMGKLLFGPLPAAWSGLSGSRLARRPAFSLVELMIVLAILSVIAAMVVPNLQRSFSKNDIRDAATQLHEVIGDLQIESSQKGSPILIQFGWDSNQLKVWRLETVATMTNSAGNSEANLNEPSLDDLLPTSRKSESDKWTEATINLLTDAQLKLTPTTNENPNSSFSTFESGVSIASELSSGETSSDSLDAQTNRPSQWSQPLIIFEDRFQRDQILWLETAQWHCPVLLSAVSGGLTIGPIKSIEIASETDSAASMQNDSKVSQ